jgi:hypothetical protein
MLIEQLDDRVFHFSSEWEQYNYTHLNWMNHDRDNGYTQPVDRAIGGGDSRY